jgi:uncharacterized protein YegP (UPF0339 family)
MRNENTTYVVQIYANGDWIDSTEGTKNKLRAQRELKTIRSAGNQARLVERNLGTADRSIQ